MEFSLNFVNSFLKIALTCSQLQSKKMPAFSFFFSAIFRCRGIIVLLLHEKLIFCVYICNISSLDFHFGVNEVARMRFINAGGPNEALWSIFGACSKHAPKHSCIWIFCFGGHEDYLSLNDVQIILQGVTQNPKYLKLPKD